MTDRDEPRVILTVGQVAERFAVDPKTVTRWAQSGKLRAFRTLGNHRRFYEDELPSVQSTATEFAE